MQQIEAPVRVWSPEQTERQKTLSPEEKECRGSNGQQGRERKRLSLSLSLLFSFPFSFLIIISAASKRMRRGASPTQRAQLKIHEIHPAPLSHDLAPIYSRDRPQLTLNDHLLIPIKVRSIYPQDTSAFSGLLKSHHLKSVIQCGECAGFASPASGD